MRCRHGFIVCHSFPLHLSSRMINNAKNANGHSSIVKNHHTRSGPCTPSRRPTTPELTLSDNSTASPSLGIPRSPHCLLLSDCWSPSSLYAMLRRLLFVPSQGGSSPAAHSSRPRVRRNESVRLTLCCVLAWKSHVCPKWCLTKAFRQGRQAHVIATFVSMTLCGGVSVGPPSGLGGKGSATERTTTCSYRRSPR